MTCRLTLADIDTATESPDGGSPETIEFFLGLRRAGLPVRLIDSDSLVARLQETDMIGIVSEWEHPWYRATIEGVYVQDVVQLIAIFKNKANSRRNGTSLSSPADFSLPLHGAISYYPLRGQNFRSDEAANQFPDTA